MQLNMFFSRSPEDEDQGLVQLSLVMELTKKLEFDYMCDWRTNRKTIERLDFVLLKTDLKLI